MNKRLQIIPGESSYTNPTLQCGVNRQISYGFSHEDLFTKRQSWLKPLEDFFSVPNLKIRVSTEPDLRALVILYYSDTSSRILL